MEQNIPSTTKKPAPYEVVGGCLVMLLVIAGLIWLFSSCSCLDSNPRMVNLKDPEKKQVKQAEKLKPDAYIISQQFMEKYLKDPDSAKFPAFSELKPQQVLWARGNEFVILSICRAKNSFGGYEAQPYGAWVEYKGSGEWECKFIGDQQKTILRALPELRKSADEEKANETEKAQTPAASEYWSKNSVGTVSPKKVERIDDIDCRDQVIRIYAGGDWDHEIMLQLPSAKLQQGVMRKFKQNESIKGGFFFSLSDGKKHWGVFDNFDDPVTLTVKNIQDKERRAVFNLSGTIRCAVPDPSGRNAFPGFVPGSDTIKLDIDIVVSGKDYITIAREKGDWKNLKLGHVYQLEGETVLANNPNPKDPVAAIKDLRKISPDCFIRIIDSRTYRGPKWYAVKVYSSTSTKYDQPIAQGWINSVGLVAQNLNMMN